MTPEIEKKYKDQNFPALEIEGLLISGEEAQATYILRQKKEFIGTSAFEQAQLNQYLSIFSSGIAHKVQEFDKAIFSGKNQILRLLSL